MKWWINHSTNFNIKKNGKTIIFYNQCWNCHNYYDNSNIGYLAATTNMDENIKDIYFKSYKYFFYDYASLLIWPKASFCFRRVITTVAVNIAFNFLVTNFIMFYNFSFISETIKLRLKHKKDVYCLWRRYCVWWNVSKMVCKNVVLNWIVLSERCSLG